jgi:hypothetical protein
MNFDRAKISVLEWIENFVEKSNSNLNDWPPCPYARRARLENRVMIQQGTDIVVDGEQIVKSWTDEYDVIITVYDRNEYSVLQVAEAVDQLNNQSTKKDILFLDDHPDDIEMVNDVCMNHGEYILLLAQRLSKINSASSDLKAQGYYNLWTKEYYDRVVGWREQSVFGDN